jgi:hypothetical protein
MTTDEAKRIHAAYQAERVKGAPAEYLEYMRAKGVLADAGLLTITAGQRAFIQAIRKPQELAP